MKTSFAKAMQEAEEEQILKACRSMYLDLASTAYVLEKYRRPTNLLETLLVMGGTVHDYVRMTVEARPPSTPYFPRRRYR